MHEHFGNQIVLCSLGAFLLLFSRTIPRKIKFVQQSNTVGSNTGLLPIRKQFVLLSEKCKKKKRIRIITNVRLRISDSDDKQTKKQTKNLYATARTYLCSATQLANLGLGEYPRGTTQSLMEEKKKIRGKWQSLENGGLVVRWRGFQRVRVF